jgi:hypothetical protein
MGCSSTPNVPSRPSTPPPQVQPIQEEYTTLSEEKFDVEDLLVDGLGAELFVQAINTYKSLYNNWKLDIQIRDIDALIKGNYHGYNNSITIKKIRNNKHNFENIIVTASYSTMNIMASFSKVPLAGGYSPTYTWQWNSQYSDGTAEEKIASRKKDQEHTRYFAGKANEAILRLEIWKRKIPEGHDALIKSIEKDREKLSDMAFHENFTG